MLRAMITPLTLYNQDTKLFDSMELPSRPFTDRGYDDLFLDGWDMDRDVLINNLLMETAELNVLYTDPDFMKFAITQWSKKELPVWQSLYETIFFKYNPIWNKDGTLKHTATETRNLARGLTRSGTNSNTITDGGSDTTSIERDVTIQRDEDSARTYQETGTRDVDTTETPTVETTETTTHGTGDIMETQVSAYDSVNYQPKEKTVTGKSGTDTVVTTPTGTNRSVVDEDTSRAGTDTLVSHNDDTVEDYSETAETAYGKTQTASGLDSSTESGTDTGTVGTVTEDQEYGNIGVTMTQQLIAEERKLVEFNIYDYIIRSFKRRFCLLIY